MQRRNLIKYGLISTTSLLCDTQLVKGRTINSSPKIYDWILLYWMPYDNDLSRFTQSIIEMITKGIQSNNILIIVQSDTIGAKNLKRQIFSKDQNYIQVLNTANSASEEVFAEYLFWAKSQFQSKKWAVIILGHGGNLDTISPDNNPIVGMNLKTQWMNIYKLSKVINKFNQDINNNLELLFLQNCNKGTIEAHYTFRDAAKYTLSSQLTLGVPNSYYESMLIFLGQNPNIHGGELAKKIIEFENIYMYHSYTVTNNLAVKKLPEKIHSLIDSLVKADLKSMNISNIQTYYYMGDRFVDLVMFFNIISQQVNGDKEKLNSFTDFIKNSVIYSYNQNGRLLLPIRKKYQDMCGLGIYLPKNKTELEKYTYLPVFSELKLRQIFASFLN